MSGVLHWVNAIGYAYGEHAKRCIEVHVVTCCEDWEGVDPQTLAIMTKKSRHVLLSSRPLSRLNVHTRCNLGARYCWGIEGAFLGIEGAFLVEKHQGYAYKHVFAQQWNAMKGYHFLMRLAHLINTVARFSKELAGLFAQLGVQAAIGLIRNTLSGPWLDPVEIEQRLSRAFRLRLR
jgi:hypothetical protein